MAVVLCVGINRALIETRKLILERAGHTAFTAMTEQEVRAKCAQRTPDVVVIGQRIAAAEKQRILAMVRQDCPATRVLELHETGSDAVLPGADDRLLVPFDVPEDLAECVALLVARGPRK
jgi:CheY-like chemotaxis protein